MPALTKNEGARTVLQLTRQELLKRLLQPNEHSSFQFTESWLNRQRTRRLRALLAERQNPRTKILDLV